MTIAICSAKDSGSSARKSIARRGAQKLLATAAGIASLGFAPNALAFCRTTTCDASLSQVGCQLDEAGCSITGAPLYWASRCLSFGVQEDGSKKKHITWQKADAIFSDAFRQWVDADCGGGVHPSISMWDLDDAYGPMVCDQVQFNQDSPNANVWIFRDDNWPHSSAAATLALTTVTFEKNSGEILDADVEINSFKVPLTTVDPGQGTVIDDLQSIATHEAGHFLGLAHSMVEGATMNKRYKEGDISFRTLSPDDTAGICAVYPPDRVVLACDQPEPSHGFSRYCAEDPASPKGCSVGLQSGSAFGGGSAAFALLALGRALRRRRARR